MKNKKITLLLISASMSILVLAGCSSTKTPTTTKKAPTTMKSSMKRNHTNSPSMMKKLYSNDLKSLVTAKIITQIQSNKVLVALTKNLNTKDSTNKLSSLVKNHIITQSQADKINQKINSGMKNRSRFKH